MLMSHRIGLFSLIGLALAPAAVAAPVTINSGPNPREELPFRGYYDTMNRQADGVAFIGRTGNGEPFIGRTAGQPAPAHLAPAALAGIVVALDTAKK